MRFLTNETLFYGGIIITASSLLSAIIYFSLSKVKSIKLKAQMNAEYGEKKQK